MFINTPLYITALNEQTLSNKPKPGLLLGRHLALKCSLVYCIFSAPLFHIFTEWNKYVSFFLFKDMYPASLWRNLTVFVS